MCLNSIILFSQYTVIHYTLQNQDCVDLDTNSEAENTFVYSNSLAHASKQDDGADKDSHNISTAAIEKSGIENVWQFLVLQEVERKTNITCSIKNNNIHTHSHAHICMLKRFIVGKCTMWDLL